jgi:hypothetical protein
MNLYLPEYDIEDEKEDETDKYTKDDEVDDDD